MKEINENLEKLKIGSCTKSKRDDLKQEGSMIFCEESSRVLYEMGNMELFELKHISVTISCRSCLRYAARGINIL